MGLHSALPWCSCGSGAFEWGDSSTEAEFSRPFHSSAQAAFNEDTSWQPSKQTARAWVISPFPVSFLKGLVTVRLCPGLHLQTQTLSLSQQAFQSFTRLFEPTFLHKNTLHATSLLSVNVTAYIYSQNLWKLLFLVLVGFLWIMTLQCSLLKNAHQFAVSANGRAA